MTPLPPPIAAQIAAWLLDGEIELFIGYEAGTAPLHATPAFIRRPEEVSRLIWDATCELNLTAYLKNYRGKRVGLMVKGCDARAINGLIQERQWQRESLRLVGVRCPGVVDRLAVARRLGVTVDEIDEATLDGDVVRVGQAAISLDQALYTMCSVCDRHMPIIYDLLMGVETPDAPSAERFAHVRAMEALASEERWAYFASEVARCNLCFACRNACPLCYCTVCFVDRTMPSWFTQSSAPEDLQFYQIMRTFHLAGRCVGCGACTRACPLGIDIRLWLDKLRADALELFGYEAGLDPEARPPLTTYREDDPNEFVL
jgi:ferredoxin